MNRLWRSFVKNKTREVLKGSIHYLLRIPCGKYDLCSITVHGSDGHWCYKRGKMTKKFNYLFFCSVGRFRSLKAKLSNCPAFCLTFVYVQTEKCKTIDENHVVNCWPGRVQPPAEQTSKVSLTMSTGSVYRHQDCINSGNNGFGL